MGWEDVPSLQNCTWVSEDFPFGIYCTIPPSSCLYRSPPAGRVKMRVRAVRSHVSQVESIRLVGEQPVCKPPAHSHNGSPSIFVFLLFGVYCPPAFCCQDCTSFMSIEEFRRKVNRENSSFQLTVSYCLWWFATETEDVFVPLTTVSQLSKNLPSFAIFNSDSVKTACCRTNLHL